MEDDGSDSPTSHVGMISSNLRLPQQSHHPSFSVSQMDPSLIRRQAQPEPASYRQAQAAEKISKASPHTCNFTKPLIDAFQGGLVQDCPRRTPRLPSVARGAWIPATQL